jgi:transposase
MSKETSLSERVEIVELSEAGLTDRQIAKQLGWSYEVVRKWRRRGRGQLKSKMGHPAKGALSSYPGEIRETVDRWRENHPGWGEDTLFAEMKCHPAFKSSSIPSAATIGRYLKEQGLTRPYNPHVELPDTKYQQAQEPHQIWQMDAQGYQRVSGVGRVSLINLNDVHSHLRLLSYPCFLGEQRVERHADTEDYQTALRLAFTEWGLPQKLQVDHESIFYDNRSQSPFPTRFHLWLVALGIPLIFSRVFRPTDQGLTERSHQLWTEQVISGQSFDDWQHLYQTLQQRRTFLNQHLPCRSLNRIPPLIAYPQATHSGRFYRPEVEADLLNLQLVYDYLACGRWYRLVSKGGTFSLGAQVYYLSPKFAKQQIEITFDPSDNHLICCQDTQVISRLSLRGLSTETLMGTFAYQFNLPHFQLALPFDFPAQNQVRLYAALGGTT